MLRNRRERGEGQFGCLMGLALVALVGLICYRMIPVKVKAAELRDTIVDEAKSAGIHNNKRIVETIAAKAAQLDLPVTEKDVKIERKHEMIFIEVQYTVPIQFPGYTYNWKFHQKTENPVF
jgi:hypothetical protein